MGRNWDWSLAHGREQRLTHERNAAEQGIADPDVSRAVPLHSHDGTMQVLFARGWNSVTPAEIYQARHQLPFTPVRPSSTKPDPCARLRALFHKDIP
jgi:hypothetical protein